MAQFSFKILFTTVLSTLFLVASAARDQHGNEMNNIQKINSIQEYWSGGCIQNTVVISENDGYMSFACNKPTNNKKHVFGTELFYKTADGSLAHVVPVENGVTVGPLKETRYGGYVHSAWGTFRAVTYPGKGENPNEIVDLPKSCDKEGSFCFDIYDNVCSFEFANKDWERPCPLFNKFLRFEADA